MAVQSYITYMSSNAFFNETNIIIITAILFIIIIGCGIITYMWTNDDDETEIITVPPKNILIYNNDLSMHAKENEFEMELEDHPFAPKHFKEPKREQISRDLDDNIFSSISKNEEFSELMETSHSSSTNNNIPPYILNKQMKKEDLFYNGMIPRPATSPLQYNSDSSSISNNFPLPNNYTVTTGGNYQIPITTNNIPINSLPISTSLSISSSLPIATSLQISPKLQIPQQVTSQIPESIHIPNTTQHPMALQISSDDYSENESLHRSSSLTRKRNSDAPKSRVTKPIKRSNSQTSFKNDEDSVKLTRGLSLSKSYDEDLVLSTSLSINKSNDDASGSYKENRKRRPTGRVGPPVVSKQQPTRGILKAKSRYAKYDKINNDTDSRKDDNKSETDRSINETELKENIELMK